MMKINDVASSSDTQNKTPRSAIESFTIKYILSCISATVAETITYPLDITKTRLQIQGELGKHGSAKKRGMIKMSIDIARQEGSAALWSGITPAVYRHIVYSGFRLVIYEQLRDAIHKESQGTKPLWKMVLVGATTGAISQFLASPMDLVKVIMQADGKRVLEGEPRRIKNVSQAFKLLYRQGGVPGLWRGAVVNVQRAALVNLGDLTTYDTTKHFLMNRFHFKDNYITHIMASICSGLVAATMSTPADVIKTRIMNQPLDENGRGTIYKNSIHCLKLTFKNEGLVGLYRGWLPTWMRMAPWSLTFWLTYEQIRKIAGVTGF